MRIIPSVTVLTTLILLVAPLVLAEPEMSPKVQSVHAPIPVSGLTTQQIRLAIFSGMLNNKGVKWSLQGEAANTIFARWDYRGEIAVMKIVYDEQNIQLFYVNASNKMMCTDFAGGICHSARSGYFNYVPHLRKSIVRQVALVSRDSSGTRTEGTQP